MGRSGGLVSQVLIAFAGVGPSRSACADAGAVVARRESRSHPGVPFDSSPLVLRPHKIKSDEAAGD